MDKLNAPLLLFLFLFLTNRNLQILFQKSQKHLAVSLESVLMTKLNVFKYEYYANLIIFNYDKELEVTPKREIY